MSEQPLAEKAQEKRIRRPWETCPECHRIPFTDCVNEDGSRRYGWYHVIASPPGAQS